MRQKCWVRANAAGSILLLTSVIFLTFAPSAAGGDQWGANYFPNVPLTTQAGTTVRFYDDLLKDKIVVIDLIYTHCQDLCPLETARLAQVQQLLGDRVGKDIFFYSISIDPERDTPAELRAYAEKFHAKPGWLFLTGKPEDIELISKKLGLYSDPDPANRDGHTPYVLLGNEATGQWIRNSALDNPRYLAVMIGDWLNSWKNPTARKSYAEAPPLSITDKGQYIFATHCAACHSIGHGDHVGPDLLGVTAVREQTWLRRMIAEPDIMLAEKDPVATALFAKYKRVTMPNLRLTAIEVDAIVNYLKAQSATRVADRGGPSR
jgi:protein SCO1/2